MVNRFKKRFKRLNGAQKTTVILGGAGSVGAATLYVAEPSFPTPDKIFIFALLVGMFFGQAKQVLYRLGPFVALLLVYESFRGIAPQLNERVNFMWMVDMDRAIFGGTLPTTTLQNWLWNGSVSWFDFVFYLPYLLHFVLPFALAIYVWKKRESEYWRYITAFIGISFFAFIIFVLFPAAPPWMASNLGYIEPIERISSHVWLAVGLNDFPSVYNELSPNPVAAVPSLHAAYSTLFAMFVIYFFKSRWKYVSLIYPFLIYTGTVYQGEHYAIDEIVGAMLGIAGFYASVPLSRAAVGSFRSSRAFVHKKLELAYRTINS